MSIDDFDRPQERPEIESAIQLPAALELDIQEYLGDLANLPMTEEQQIELLQILWAIMRSFAEAGYKGDVCALLFGMEDAE